MTACPTWFGDPARPLFGQLHLPDGGQARGGIVLCPTMGTESLSSHRALRELAGQLSARGFAALRFDYEGSGDSSGDGDAPDAVARWLASIDAAIAYLRNCGVVAVGLLGFRIGATMAALRAARDGMVAAAVLWDPCANGRAFLREAQALKVASLGELPSEGVEIPEGTVEVLGATYGPEVITALSGLGLQQLEGPIAPRVLVLTRDDRPVPRALEAALVSMGEVSSVTRGVAAGQAELVDVLPNEAQLPTGTMAAMVDWLDHAMRNDLHQPVSPVIRHEALLSGPASCIERMVELGPLGLFGIVTEPLGWPAGPSVPAGPGIGSPGPPTAPPTVVFLNAGLIHHVGPARLWVDLARRFAAQGLRSLRFDLSGLGDSPWRLGQQPHLDYPAEATEDVAAAVWAVSDDGPPGVVLTGLCAGAYHSIECGIALSPRGVCAINPILTFDPSGAQGNARQAGEPQAAVPFNRWINALKRSSRLAAFGEHRVPPAIWWLLDRTGIQPHPARGLERLSAQGVTTLLLCGETEARPFERRARWAMKKLQRTGRLEFVVLRSSDHTLFGASGRRRAVKTIGAHVLDHYGAGLAPSLEPAAVETPCPVR